MRLLLPPPVFSRSAGRLLCAPGSYAANVSQWECTRCAAGFFQDDAGEGYVMLQNPNRPRGAWPNNRADAMTLSVDFDFSGAPDAVDPTSVLALDKDTGAVGGLPLRAHGDGTATLDVTLVAGDVVFFKYATGAPFALGPAAP